MNKRIFSTFLIFLVAVTPVNILNFVAYEDYFTHVSSIELDTSVYPVGYATYFTLIVMVEVWNPQIYTIKLSSPPSVSIQINLEIQFENGSLSYNANGGGMPTIGEYKIRPGINLKSDEVALIVSGWNDTELPQGVYTFFGQLEENKTENCFKTYLNVTVDDQIITKDTLPKNWGRKLLFRSDWPFLVLSVSLLSATLIVYYVYQRFLGKKI